LATVIVAFGAMPCGYCTLLAARTNSLEEWLFAFAMLGDDRTVMATYEAGRKVHVRA
jgi:hypothetical protein